MKAGKPVDVEYMVIHDPDSDNDGYFCNIFFSAAYIINFL